ncbi:hypothetical protein RCOM_1104900 [Ricinus communis]|uniref:F-box domain-containing protein n=1 Tax=Ricinus communis TaxID=3988 RepID=B9SAM6_RICCO|nr:hypothetical protein RCOM_1104900 [Ricinus communis]|eukprot:XP_002523045.1 F-box protein At5g07610 [Ricinus communis]
MMSAAATVAEIEDLVIEILLRVPTKELLRCKCVSKQWLSLISDPHFCASHSRFQQSFNPRITALFLDVNKHIPEFQVIPLVSSPFTSGAFVVKDYFNVRRAKILQSCNGLLLCRSSFLVHFGVNRHPYFEDFDINDRGYFYFIYNPTTRQFKKLSLPTSVNEKLRISGNELAGTGLLSVCLVFDPVISSHYRIIFISNLCDLKDSTTYWLEVCIYSSEFDTWTSQRASVDIEIFLDISPQPVLGIYNYNHGVYCYGSMHWLRCDAVYSLLSFDVDTLSFNKQMHFPDDIFVRYFGESQGHLHCVTYKHGYPDLEYDVMEIAADYSEWSLTYHVNLQSIRRAYRCRGISILSVIRDENAEELILVISVDESPVAYHLSDGTHRRLYDSGTKLAYCNYRVYPCFQSLICV